MQILECYSSFWFIFSSESCYISRHTCCKYSRIGCPWQGPFHELASHEQSCIHPNKSGDDIMNALSLVDKQKEEELRVYSNLYCLLSYEKVTFNDLQLKPYRTDDFITRLYYETSRFSAFNHQWVIKARINNDKPTQSVTRSMSYQLVLKGKVTNPIQLKFIALKGPYGDMKVNPAIYMFEFSPENVETEYFDLPIVSSLECNKLLASKTINLRVIMVHLQ